MLTAHGMLNERTIAVASSVKRVADQLGATPAQVALAWTLLNPSVAAPLLGARTLRQLEDNLGALKVELAEEQWLSSLRRVDSSSASRTISSRWTSFAQR